MRITRLRGWVLCKKLDQKGRFFLSLFTNNFIIICDCHFICVDWFWHFSNLTFNAFILCILPLWGWLRSWPKRVGGHCVYNYFQYTCVHFAGTVIIYNRLMRGLWITYIQLVDTSEGLKLEVQTFVNILLWS